MGSKPNKIQNRVNYLNREGYLQFIKKYPKSDIIYEQYIKILKYSNTEIRDCILNYELGFKLPYNLGYVAVDKFKPSKKYIAVDWVNTKRLKKMIPLTNFHTFGYTYNIKIFKNPRSKPLEGYLLKAHRKINRMIADKIKNENKDYLSIDPTYYSSRFRIENSLKHNQQ